VAHKLLEKQRSEGSRFKANPGKNLGRPQYQQTKQGMVVHAYNPKYVGGISRKIVVQGQSREISTRPYLKNNLKSKGLDHGSSGRAPV
jgi:hypothetical protein